jgi:hypothetical protein
MNRKAMIKAAALKAETSTAMTVARPSPVSTDHPVTEGSNDLEVTKALRVGVAPVQDLTIHFRKFAAHTNVGSMQDEAQIITLRNEAAEMAFAIKATVPGVTWDWLCKILSEEYTRTIAESEKNMGKVRRYYGTREVPDVVERFYKK